MGIRAARSLGRRERTTGVEALMPRGIWWSVGFVALYSVLWIVADIAGVIDTRGNGLSVWYINAAFDITLFLVLGWRWWPLPVALTAASILVYPADRWGSFSVNVIAQAPYELILALATKLTVDWLRVRFPLRSVRGVAEFAGMLCLAGPIVANAAFVAMYSILDVASNPWSAFPIQFLRGTVADTTAIIVLVPVITQCMAWRSRSGSPGAERVARLDRNFWFGLTATFAVVVAEYVIGARTGRVLEEFSLLPLAWLGLPTECAARPSACWWPAVPRR